LSSGYSTLDLRPEKCPGLVYSMRSRHCRPAQRAHNRDNKHPCTDYPSYCALNLWVRVLPPPPSASPRHPHPTTSPSPASACTHRRLLPPPPLPHRAPATRPLLLPTPLPPCNWLPPPHPYPPQTSKALGAAGVHRSPKRQWPRWGGGCGGGGADHGATGSKTWPLPTTSRRNDIKTIGAVEGGRQGKKDDTGQGAKVGPKSGKEKQRRRGRRRSGRAGGGGGRVEGPVGAYKERGEDSRGWQ